MREAIEIEQFTQIELDEMNDSAVITTSSPAFIKKLNALSRIDSNVKFVSEPHSQYTRIYLLPKEYIRIRRPRRVKTMPRIYTNREFYEAAKLYHEKRKELNNSVSQICETKEQKENMENENNISI